MRISVCGIACEVCPRRRRGACPSGDVGCRPRENARCPVAACAHAKGSEFCFDCEEFPCATLREHGPIVHELCLFLAEREG
ncbi:MAG: DUF3795 domain-containing protein [bacterium]|nr:DUF3795 domain-containing protein [bacterium]